MIPIPASRHGSYKIIKYCRGCKTRMVVSKGESKKNYCDKCLKNFEKQQGLKED